MRVVTNAEQVLSNIARLQTELEKSQELADRLGFVHAWYVDTRKPEDPQFGFSKFAGYQDLDAETYLRNYKDLDGRNTEWVLKDFFEELRPGTSDYSHYHKQLTEWLAMLGRAPRKKVRLMVLKPEFRGETEAEDRRLLELLSVVAGMLPPHQRQELRDKL
ncbi:hypothetical protein CEW88_04780 [Alloyangia pacifica]|uniref:Uncharacterized protein n=1 Tax=Alloyangia pacifica TaxID=311180 RepID=A0A2U8HED3_9RHOB|nr:hypothetical protein [Alloyangia pacifica]AWI83035.1 hypothetical protein CEW88_04780 [Alloyangia pacifica]